MNGPIEPNAGLRGMATELYELYVSLVSAGFTEAQAIVLLGEMIKSQRT